MFKYKFRIKRVQRYEVFLESTNFFAPFSLCARIFVVYLHSYTIGYENITIISGGFSDNNDCQRIPS